MNRKIKLSIFFVGVASVSFLIGFRNGLYKDFPYNLYKSIQELIHESTTSPVFKGEKEILDIAFTDPVYHFDDLLIVPKVSSIDSVEAILEKWIIPVDSFDYYYSSIRLLGDSVFQTSSNVCIQKVDYLLWGQKLSAYAYCKIARGSNEGSAFLIIPGSGLNQSSAIYYHDQKNYQYGIFELLESKGDVFILVKPNEDFLAIHDGGKKLNKNFFVNYLLNKGGSYSALYIAHSFALSKFLKEKYEKYVVVGLSQGGMAAFVNALQSEPDIVIVSSGFSFLFDKIEGSGHDQIIIPCGCFDKYNEIRFVKDKVASLNTFFLFTWGEGETDFYKYESYTKYTCSLLDLPNVECIIHELGHVYPIEEISFFLEKKGI